jgi:hypothetical protein
MVTVTVKRDKTPLPGKPLSSIDNTQEAARHMLQHHDAAAAAHVTHHVALSSNASDQYNTTAQPQRTSYVT